MIASAGYALYVTSTDIPGDENQILISGLTVVDRFPDTGDPVFLRNTIDLLVHDNQIYVSDQTAHTILKFTERGSFIDSIGRRGRGPGELYLQRDMAASNDTLIVNNGWNIQVYHTSGEDITWFPSVGMGEFLFHEGKLIAVKPSVNPRYDESFDDQYLLKILNMESDVEARFCPMLGLVPTEFAFHRWEANAAFLDIYDGRLYVMYKYYPIFRIYNLDDLSLLEEWNLAERNPFLRYRERADRNYNPDSFRFRDAIGVRRVFRGLDVTDDGIFISLQADYIVLDRFGLDGVFLERFEMDPPNDQKIFLTDFSMIDGKSFYGLVSAERQEVWKIEVN